MRSCLILFFLLLAPEALAQETSIPEAPAQEELRPVQVPPPLVQAPEEPAPPPPAATPTASLELTRGAPLRVDTTDGKRSSGVLLGVSADTLSLQMGSEQPVTLRLIDVEHVESRKRSPGQGALVGTVVGGLSGGLFLGLLCAAFSDGADSPAACGLVGGLIGGAIGAASGALVGLLVPRWSTVYEKEEQGALSLRMEEPGWLSAVGPIGELNLKLGYARDMGTARPTQGWGGRLQLLALIGPYLALGPELAWYPNVGSERTVLPGGQVFDENRSLTQFGGVARVGVEVGPTRTALLAGLGLNENRSGSAGASVGGEVEVQLSESLPPLAFDVRYHFNIDDSSFNPNYLTFGAGSRFRW